MISRLLAIPGLPLPREGQVHVTPTRDEQLDNTKRRITAELAALRGARAVRDHCPSVENEQAVDRFEAKLAELLDELTTLLVREEMETL